MPKSENVGLTTRQVQTFIDDGFVKIEDAFSTDLAEQCRGELWAAIGLSPDEPAGWTRPVVRLGLKASPPFIAAANTPRLRKAYDQLVGVDRWCPPRALGTFAIRLFTPRNLTGGNGRVSWRSRPCCRRKSLIRRCRPRRSRSPSGTLAV